MPYFYVVFLDSEVSILSQHILVNVAATSNEPAIHNNVWTYNLMMLDTCSLCKFHSLIVHMIALDSITYLHNGIVNVDVSVL